jgi:Fanconi anemia group M protein
MSHTMARKNKDFPKIIMDERERGEIRLMFQNLPCNLEIRTLELGDYILSSKVAIERKRGDDFVSSIYDHRLFQQLHELKTKFSWPIIILESPKKLFLREFIKKSPIYGALMYIIYKLQIPIISTSSPENTAEFVYRLAKIEQNKPNYTPYIQVEADKEKEHTISREDQSYFLQGLIDSGPVKANKFLDIFKTPQFIFHAITSTEIEYTRGGNPKKISGIMEKISGIGVKFIHRNQKLLTSSYKENKKSKERIRS